MALSLFEGSFRIHQSKTPAEYRSIALCVIQYESFVREKPVTGFDSHKTDISLINKSWRIHLKHLVIIIYKKKNKKGTYISIHLKTPTKFPQLHSRKISSSFYTQRIIFTRKIM